MRECLRLPFLPPFKVKQGETRLTKTWQPPAERFHACPFYGAIKKWIICFSASRPSCKKKLEIKFFLILGQISSPKI
jgi:hypothetical protein